MNKIVWTEDLITGNPQLDEQHRRLARVINRLIEIRDHPASREVTAELLDETMSFVIHHFSEEEALMEQNGMPQLDVHRAEHARFAEEVTAMCMEAISRRDGVAARLLHLLYEHWDDHIRHEVSQLRPYCQTA